MAFSITVDPSSAKELAKIKKGTPAVLILISKKIDSLSNAPYGGKPLHGNNHGCFSLREGDYRIIYEVLLDDKIVNIIAVGHRKDIYR